MNKFETQLESSPWSPEIGKKMPELLEESRTLTQKIRDIINSLNHQDERAMENSGLPALEARLAEIDQEIQRINLEHRTETI